MVPVVYLLHVVMLYHMIEQIVNYINLTMNLISCQRSTIRCLIQKMSVTLSGCSFIDFGSVIISYVKLRVGLETVLKSFYGYL